MDGDGEDQEGDGDGEPGLAQQVLEEGEADDLEQGRTQQKQDPEGGGEGERHGQLHPGLPGGVEIGWKARDAAALEIGRGNQMVADEQGGGREQDHGRGQVDLIVQGPGALTGDVVQAQQGEGDTGDDGPDCQGEGAQAAYASQQHQRQEADDEQKRAEQQGFGRGPTDLATQAFIGGAAQIRPRLDGPVQPVEAEALEQADADPDRAQQGRGGAAEAVAAGRFGGLGHGGFPLWRDVTAFWPACIVPA